MRGRGRAGGREGGSSDGSTSADPCAAAAAAVRRPPPTFVFSRAGRPTFWLRDGPTAQKANPLLLLGQRAPSAEVGWSSACLQELGGGGSSQLRVALCDDDQLPVAALSSRLHRRGRLIRVVGAAGRLPGKAAKARALLEMDSCSSSKGRQAAPETRPRLVGPPSVSLADSDRRRAHPAPRFSPALARGDTLRGAEVTRQHARDSRAFYRVWAVADRHASSRSSQRRCASMRSAVRSQICSLATYRLRW